MLSLIADRLRTTKDRLQQQILDGTIAPELSTSDAVEEISAVAPENDIATEFEKVTEKRVREENPGEV